MIRNAFTPLSTLFLVTLWLGGPSWAADSAGKRPVNDRCPISGEPVNPECTTTYEDRTYAFCSGKCRREFRSQLGDSLYHKLGGKAAIDAAVDRFYVKVLADERINFFFEDINMRRQHNKQKAFLSAALGGPIPWEGKDLRTAHANLSGLNDKHFNAVAEHLQSTLEELEVEPALLSEVMAVVESTRDAVLGRPPEAG